jgi:hypothetical protein
MTPLRASLSIATVLASLAAAVALTTGSAVIPVAAAGGPWPEAFDKALREDFRLASSHEADAPYRELFAYLVTNAVDRRTPSGSAVMQPGAPSRHGAAVDAMEGFTRMAPLVATWVAGGRPSQITDLRGRKVDLLVWMRTGVTHGTDPASPGYWGKARDFDQRIVEAADVARSLWILRDILWPTLTEAERSRVLSWLGQVAQARPSDNNWNLYPVLIQEVIRSFGGQVDEELSHHRWARFASFRIGGGWYSDGEERGNIDWYAAWGIYYELWWIRRISPGYGGATLADDLRSFVGDLTYLIGPSGIPIMGRSVCYRLAAPAPLVAAALAGPDRNTAIHPGLARHALDAVTGHFVERGAFAGGAATQGYCAADLRVLDNYSGPSSCLWSLRALTLAFLAGPGDALWTAPEQPLPVDQSSYSHPIPAAGWTAVGNAATGDVQIVRTNADPSQSPALEPYGTWRRALSTVLWWRPYRPDNLPAKYERPSYSALDPFCGCPVPAPPEPAARSGAIVFRGGSR